MLFVGVRKTFWPVLQIVSHSHSRDGTWLSPDSLRQILAGLEACPTGMSSFGLYVSVLTSSRNIHNCRKS